MSLATVMLLLAAVLWMRLGMPAFLSVWLAPVFIAMIYDYLYVIGIVALIVIGFRDLLSGTDVWTSIAKGRSRLAS